MGVVVAGPDMEPDDGWEQALARVLADAAQPRLVFQPVVDLHRGVVAGYEALARFDGFPAAPPDQWFRAATAGGVAGRLQARIIATALAARPGLPQHCFLSINLDPNLLIAPEVAEALTAAGSLGGVVIEVTEHVGVDDYEAVLPVLSRCRDLGVSVAVDDAGAGYASLLHILRLRPEFVKLDSSLVTGMDRDGAKVALVEMLGAFASKLDAWLVAEGVERPEEIETLVRLKVPLAQGCLLAPPQPGWAQIDGTARQHILERVTARNGGATVAGLVARVTPVSEGQEHDAVAMLSADPALDVVPVVDRWSRPVGVLTREAAMSGHPAASPQKVKTTSPIAEVAARAMTRPLASRFHPLVCCDDAGRYLGVVRLERLVEELAR